MEEINIKDFWDYYRKYIVIVIAIAFLGMLCIFIYDIALKKPLYSTYTTVVLVKDTNNEGIDTIDQSDIILNQKLVSTYREIIKSRLILRQVIDNLNLNYTTDKISKEISVQALSDTEILKIVVTDPDANLAASIANELASVFENEITKIYKINNISIIDTAQPPKYASNIHKVRDVALAGIILFVGTSAIIFVIFYFDDTIRIVDDIESSTNVPVVAKIYKDNNGIDLIVDKKPNAMASESIRTLRTNLQFSSIDNELKTILITSSVPSANLAIAFAQTGKKVLLIDCDLRKGRQHKIFKLKIKEGLSNLLINDIVNCNDYISQTSIKNLYVMPRGIVPPNPSELLNSKKNASLITHLRKYFDVVILDGAPINGIADSLILSTYVDKVLLVSCLNHTPKTEFMATIKSLNAVNANLAGCIINNIDSHKHGYGKYYYYGEHDND